MAKVATLNRLENMLDITTGGKLIRMVAQATQSSVQGTAADLRSDIYPKALYPGNAFNADKRSFYLSTSQVRQRIIKLADKATQTK